MKYSVRPTSKFQRDLRRVQKRRWDISLMTDTIKKLALGQALPDKNRDHALTGNYSGTRECHITSDWLLIYEIDEASLTIYLTRTGTHSDLF